MRKITKREQNKRLLRSKIMQSAKGLFETKRFSDITIAQIMKGAGLGLGTFYNYFTSKEEILVALLTDIGDAMVEDFRTNTPPEADFVDSFIDLVVRAGGILERYPYFLPLLDMHNRNIKSPGFGPIFTKILEDGKKQGYFIESVRSDILAELFHAIFFSVYHSNLKLSFSENIRAKTTLIVEGLRAR